MDIKQVLKNYGLTEEEASLYLAGLKIGEAPLSLIAKEAGLKRSSAYLIAKSLEEKGLMGSFKMRSGLKFVSSSPSFLKKQLSRRLSDIEEIMPELNALEKKSRHKPKITLYEGKDGYLAILEDSLKTTNGIIRSIGSLKKLYEVITPEYDNKYYIPTRMKNKTKYRGLHFELEAGNIFTPERNVKEMREVKFLPPDYHHSAFIMIYLDSIAILTSKKELIAVKIESKEIAQSEKAKFDLIWNLL